MLLLLKRSDGELVRGELRRRRGCPEVLAGDRIVAGAARNARVLEVLGLAPDVAALDRVGAEAGVEGEVPGEGQRVGRALGDQLGPRAAELDDRGRRRGAREVGTPEEDVVADVVVGRRVAQLAVVVGVGGLEHEVAAEQVVVAGVEPVAPLVARHRAVGQDGEVGAAVALEGVGQIGDAQQVGIGDVPADLAEPLLLVGGDVAQVHAGGVGHGLLAVEQPVAGEEPGLVLHDRPAEGDGGVVGREVRVRAVLVVGDQVVVLEVVVGRAGEGVAAALGDDVGDQARSALELGRQAAGQDRLLLDDLGVQVGAEGAGVAVGDVDALDVVDVVGGLADDTVDVREVDARADRRVAGRRREHPGDHLQEALVGAAGRHRVGELERDVGAGDRAGRVDQRRFGGDDHLLGDLGELQLDADDRGLAGADEDLLVARPGEPFEPRGDDPGVRRIERAQQRLAVRGGGRRALHQAVRGLDRNGGPGQRRPIGVGDHDADRSARDLGGGGPRHGEHRQRGDGEPPHQTLSHDCLLSGCSRPDGRTTPAKRPTSRRRLPRRLLLRTRIWRKLHQFVTPKRQFVSDSRGFAPGPSSASLPGPEPPPPARVPTATSPRPGSAPVPGPRAGAKLRRKQPSRSRRPHGGAARFREEAGMSWTRSWRRASLAAALALAAAGVGQAQSQSSGGAIEGTVRDESGAVLPGVAVAIRNPETAFARATETDAAGRFRAPLLPVGRYDIAASLEGFATTRREGFVLQIGQTLVVDLTLSVAATEEAIVVTAEAPVIETTRSSQSSTVNARAIENLPVNGRNFIDFVLTTPGVTRDVRLGDISLRRPARHPEQPGRRRRRQQQHLLRPDPRPHRLGPRPLPVLPGRRAGVPGQPHGLLGRVRPRRRRGDQRRHQVGHQRLPRLDVLVLPRQVAQREQLRQRAREPAQVALPVRPVRRLARRPAGQGPRLLLRLLRRAAQRRSRTTSTSTPTSRDSPCRPTPTPRPGSPRCATRPAPGSAARIRTSFWSRPTGTSPTRSACRPATTGRTSPAPTSRTAAPPTPSSTPATAWSRPRR